MKASFFFGVFFVINNLKIMKKLVLFYFIFFFTEDLFAITLKLKLHHTDMSYTAFSDILMWNKKSMIYKDKPDYKFKSNENGELIIDLPSGEYYIFVEKIMKNKYLSGYYGLNPLRLYSDQTININLIDFGTNFMKKISKNVIEGLVTYNSLPVSDVDVLVYLDLSTELKGPPYSIVKTDEKGKFRVQLEEGSYYLVFKKKKNFFGPPAPGDFISFFPSFPIVIKKNVGYEIKVELLKISSKINETLNKLIKIKGYVKDKNGSYLKNVYVIAYDRDELLGKPKYVSSKTKQDGYFEIYLKEAGRYYIVVRKNLGDTPEMNEIFVFGDVIVEDNKNEKELDIIADFDS